MRKWQSQLLREKHLIVILMVNVINDPDSRISYRRYVGNVFHLKLLWNDGLLL